jgi:hypothetical protein
MRGRPLARACDLHAQAAGLDGAEAERKAAPAFDLSRDREAETAPSRITPARGVGPECALARAVAGSSSTTRRR